MYKTLQEAAEALHFMLNSKELDELMFEAESKKDSFLTESDYDNYVDNIITNFMANRND